jgi:hypothetical protein
MIAHIYIHRKEKKWTHEALDLAGQKLIAPAGLEEPPASELMPAAELMPACASSSAVIPARRIRAHVRTFG